MTDLIAQIAATAAVPAVVLVAVTGTVLIVATKWRYRIVALAIQYLLVVLLLARVIRVELAAVKGLTGWLICAVYYVTETRVGSVGPPSTARRLSRVRTWRGVALSPKGWFHLLAAVTVSVVAYGAALRMPLPDVPAHITLACYLMGGLGLLLVGLEESPFGVGLGLLTLLSGVDIFYVGLEPSLAVAGLIGAVGFLIALSTSYLRSAQVGTGEEEQA